MLPEIRRSRGSSFCTFFPTFPSVGKSAMAALEKCRSITSGCGCARSAGESRTARRSASSAGSGCGSDRHRQSRCITATSAITSTLPPGEGAMQPELAVYYFRWPGAMGSGRSGSPAIRTISLRDEPANGWEPDWLKSCPFRKTRHFMPGVKRTNADIGSTCYVRHMDRSKETATFSLGAHSHLQRDFRKSFAIPLVASRVFEYDRQSLNFVRASLELAKLPSSPSESLLNHVCFCFSFLTLT